MFKKLTVGAVIAASFGLVNAAPAVAEDGPPQPTAAFAGHLVAGPGAVTVKIAYTCDHSVSPFNHLFVAVKQGPDVSPENAGTDSGAVVSFYSTNWKSDVAPNALQCDGTRHVQTLVLKKQPVQFWPPSATQPRIHAGQALVQICVFDNVVPDPENPDGDPLSQGFALDYTMQHVVAGK